MALCIDAFGVAADLTESREATTLVAAVAERRGRIDILVNNAGMTSVSRPEQPAAAGITGANVAIDFGLSAGV